MNLQRQSTPYESGDTYGYTTAPTEEQEGGINLRILLATVWRGRWIIMLCVAVGLVMAYLIISQMRPVYVASGTMLFRSGETNVTDIRTVVLAEENLSNEIQILLSTSLLGAVVDRLGMVSSAPEVPSPPPSFQIRDLINWRTYVSPEFLASIGIVDPPAPQAPPDASTLQDRRRLGAIYRIRGSLSLNPIPNSRVITISYRSGNPAEAARIVNAVADEFIRNQLQAKVDATRAASEWLGDRINSLRVRVENAELAVEAARSRQNAAAGQSSQVTQQQLQAISGQLAAARAERASAEVSYRAAEAALAAGPSEISTISLFRDAPVIQRLRSREDELLDQDANLATFASSSPNRVFIRAEIDRIQQSIRNEAASIVRTLENDLEVARARENVLQDQVSAIEELNQEQRRGEVQLRQLEREAEASRVLYENFLGRLEETQQQETLVAADARLLTRAEVPTTPVGAGKKRVLLMFIVLGVGAGIGIIFLLDKLNNTFRGVKQLEDYTGLPVLAVLPTVGAEMDRSEVIEQLYEKPNGHLAEAVRNLRTSLLFGSAKTAPKVVVFTSSVPGEGKSTSSLLLALTSQQMGRSAIIVDCDMRLRGISSLVQHEDDRPGLLSVLKGTATVDEAVDVDPNTGLMILACRPGETDRTLSAADIVASRYFSDLVTHLSKVFDLVVLDTPPVLAVADARIAASLADAIVYAVRWDDTPRGAVVEGLRELRGVDAPIAGLALTMVDNDRVATYAYEGYGHYRARYSEYYQ
ncbi:GumC family protein [Acuticoccus yangtzensis]|uniref:GumC family protein n=1 Tax=Acuticoccus yangtzensis TaxID=1443441 RepID=UPI000949AB5B|nr:Wzz/FepE/Etk N-terminal domain-containing protein [Acuticoccus yangtzensis]